jgi:flagellar hook assembly protein FlgD
VPDGIELLSNFPNPSSGATTIEYRLSFPSEVDLVVFDVLGRSVRRLDEGPKPAGLHRATWNTRSESGQILSPGIYFYRLLTTDARTGTQTVATRKMTVVR